MDPSFMRFRAARAAQFRRLIELLHTSYGSSSRAASAVARGLLSRIALAPRGASMPWHGPPAPIAEPVNGGGTCVSGRVAFADGPSRWHGPWLSPSGYQCRSPQG